MANNLADESSSASQDAAAHETVPHAPAPVSPHAGEGGGSMLELARRLLLGGVGTVSMTLDEINDFVQRLVGRGAISPDEVEKLVQEYVEARPNGAGDKATESTGGDGTSPGSLALARPDKTPSALERSVETILVRLNVPTRSDIENLSRKITLLSEKVSRLKELRDAEQKSAAHALRPDEQPERPVRMRAGQTNHANGQTE